MYVASAWMARTPQATTATSTSYEPNMEALGCWCKWVKLTCFHESNWGRLFASNFGLGWVRGTT